MIQNNLGWEVICRNMNKLSFLEVSGDLFAGNYDVDVSQPFSQHLYKLRWFSWNVYPGQSLPKTFRPINLLRLNLEFSRIERTPNFSHMPNLEMLDLRCSRKLIYVHPSLGNHKKISIILLRNCQELEEFPRIVDMISLIHLDLSGTRLRSFPEIIGNVKRLVELHLDETEIRTLPLSIEQATNLRDLTMCDCPYLVTLPIIFLGPRLSLIGISSKSLNDFKGNIDDESVSEQSKQLIGSRGMEQLSLIKVYFECCAILEEIPDSLLSRTELLVIAKCPIITGWIYFNLVDLLDKYQHLSKLIIHQDHNEEVPHDIPQAFFELELMSDMLRRRETPFQVGIPRGKIPSWFQYQFSRPSVNVFLPPLLEWYTDKLRGFLITGINVDLKNAYVFPQCCVYYDCHCCPGSLHVVVMYIPIDYIMRDITDGDRQNGCILLDLNSNIKENSADDVLTSPRWGLSLVYSEGEVNEVDPHQIMIVIDDDSCDSCNGTFRVKLAGSGDKMENVNNHISWPLFQQDLPLQGEGTMAS